MSDIFSALILIAFGYLLLALLIASLRALIPDLQELIRTNKPVKQHQFWPEMRKDILWGLCWPWYLWKRK